MVNDPFSTKPVVVSETIGGIDAKLDSLLTSLKVKDDEKSRVAGGDLSRLNDSQVSAICAWYAESCGLHPSDVCAFKLNGVMRPYVKASGVLRKARELVQTIEHGSPSFQGRMVLIECMVTLKDGTRWHDVAAREIVDSKSIMACSTAATVRALRLAIGIPIPSENEYE